MEQNKITIQEWIPIEKILNNGVIKLKSNKYIKLIKINPINFNLKSNFEKESILNSYKIFLKTCNFNIQILIQSNKQDLQKNINNIQKNLKNENREFLNNIANDYFDFINNMNSQKNSSTKDFYIILEKQKNAEEEIEDLICEELNDNFFKVKECLLRCGNSVKNINNKKEIIKILYSFLNTRLINL